MGSGPWGDSAESQKLVFEFSGDIWVDVEGGDVLEAGGFIEVLTGGFGPGRTNSLPFPEALEPVLREALGGCFQLVLELQHRVLLVGFGKKI